MYLAGHAELVAGVVGLDLGVQGVIRKAVQQGEVGVVDVQSLLQHRQHAVPLDLLVQPL
ncbi:hypothetical protein D9M68_760150 [compost metagenome]